MPQYHTSQNTQSTKGEETDSLEDTRINTGTWENITRENTTEERAMSGTVSQTLSAQDVLQENPQQDTSSSWSIEHGEDTASWSLDMQNTDANTAIPTLCEKPLRWPIKLGAKNDVWEVKRLEQFLISQGENIHINGIYGNDDFEAVKRFQLRYRAQILDPWDIKNATGYVFRTTVKTMNELACGKTYNTPSTSSGASLQKNTPPHTASGAQQWDIPLISDESSL